ncbi:family 78 glycoside hydrolase catalytic domain [Paenibacillus hodogayensis]|uniref:alpha-L-rhamnosidase n=1 Tax=Paenibacillus hodogayensis TaxID=279208 RepID=A0ABV5VSW2_9BACL
MVEMDVERTEWIIEDLRVNGIGQPMGADGDSIAFSWKLSGGRRGISQAGYRILVSAERQEAGRLQGEIWDSGYKEGHPLFVPYEGMPLGGQRRYWWKAIVRDDEGGLTESESVRFDTGLFPEQWKAMWIWKPGDVRTNDFAYFRKTFRADREIGLAKLFVSAHHVLELFVNGRRVTGYGSPAPTNPEETKYYLAYDVTELLRTGDNCLAAIVHYLGGDGQNYVNGYPGLLLQGHIEYADRTSTSVVTDESWDCLAVIPHRAGTPYQQNRRITAVEAYDARLADERWTRSEYEGRCTKAVPALQNGECRWPMKWQAVPEGNVDEIIVPVPKDVQEIGCQVFDAGKIVSGWPRLTVKGFAGATVRMRYSEDLDERGYVKHNVCNETSEHYYDEYTMTGAEIEIWEPSLSFKAFRYVEVTGFQELLGEGGVQIVSAHTALPRTGDFRSSSELLNDLYEACVQTQKNNALGQLVDCPHREQAQYLADSDLQAELLLNQFDSAAIVEKVLADFTDGQLADGTFPFVYPSNFEHHDFHIRIPEWDLHFPTLLHKLYRHTGDTRLLQRFYGPARRMALHYTGLADAGTGLVPRSRIKKPRHWHISDHPYPEIDHSGEYLTVQNMKLAHDLNLMAEMADAMGDGAEAALMDSHSRALKGAILTHLYDAGNRRFRDCYGSENSHQGTNAVALHYGFVPPEHKEQALETVAAQGLQTKTLLSLDLLHVLFRQGKAEEGYQLLTKTDFPGWGYMIRQGSRTIWEGFRDIESHCHAWNAYPAKMMVEYLAGIQLAETGWRRIRIKPFVPENLDRAEGSVTTPRGKVKVRWEKGAGGAELKLNVEIPVGSAASVWIPSHHPGALTVSESGMPVWTRGACVPDGQRASANEASVSRRSSAAGIDSVEAVQGAVVIHVRPGRYVFESRHA